MSAVAPADNTVGFIRRKVRRLTSSPSESSLPTAIIDQYINNVYTNDFPYGIKIDQMRDVYTFFTQPYIDRYPLDVNYSQGVRAPLYVDGIQGLFMKDREQFYSLYPKTPTRFQPATGDGANQQFDFAIAGPILSNAVTIGTVSVADDPIIISDDGNGSLYYRSATLQTFVPVQNTNPGIPGMHNANTGNPGLIDSIYVGTVNYVTGAFSFNLALANVIPGDGENLTLWVKQYQTGRPSAMLFWNNELTIRPIPKLVHRIEIEIYLTPVQFMLATDTPILNQWAKYLAYLVAKEILQDRSDTDGANSLVPELMKQEGLVLERQAVENIGQPVITIFNSINPSFFSTGGQWYGQG